MPGFKYEGHFHKILCLLSAPLNSPNNFFIKFSFAVKKKEEEKINALALIPRFPNKDIGIHIVLSKLPFPFICKDNCL